MRAVAEPLNLVITGVGGQGNLLASEIVATVACGMGYLVSVGETYGLNQRGGAVMSHVRIGRVMQYGPLVPRREAHLVVGFEPLETIRVASAYAAPDAVVLYNPRPFYPTSVAMGGQRYPNTAEVEEILTSLVSRVESVPATVLARQAGLALVQNVVMVGALAGSGVLPFAPRSYEDAILQVVPQDRREVNLIAFRLGFAATRTC